MKSNKITLGYKMRAVTTLMLLLIGFGCDDFLEKPLQGELTQEGFPENQADAEAATNAAYYFLREGLYHTGLFPIDDIMSDDARKGSNPDDQRSTIGPYDRFEHNNTDQVIRNWWNTLYSAIRSANVVIEFVPDIDMDESLKANYIAQARFLRALHYFYLVRAFGGVPIVTSAVPESGLKRASVSDVYTLIVQDLEYASDFLPEKSTQSTADLGRATRGAANALLAKVYLFQGSFGQAEDYALAVINSGEYDLDPDFEMASSLAGEHGVGSVFEIGAVFGTQEGLENGTNFYANVQGVRGTPNKGWGFNRPSLDLINSFEPNDPRLDATVIFLGETLDGVTISGDGTTPDQTEVDGVLVEIECYNQKVWTPGQIPATSQGHNRRIIRYADVLLMAAEALNENGKTTEALTYLNMVRERARQGNSSILPDITETDQALLRDIILEERRHELALEGHRYWDLLRTGKAAEVLGPLGFQTGKHELLPIPDAEIKLTFGELTQNPNWE